MSEKGAGGPGTAINLLCLSSSSKPLQLEAFEGEGIDVGNISRRFGLDPSTVTLNGHYVSRGKGNFVSSLTWRSLLSFFRSRGLSTGNNPSNAVLIRGNPSKEKPPIDGSDDKLFEMKEDAQMSKRKTFTEELHRTELLKKRKTNDCQPEVSNASKEVRTAFSGATSISLGCAEGGLKRVREDEMALAARKRIR